MFVFLRLFSGAIGIFLLFLAGVTNYAGKDFLFADHWVLNGRSTVFFRLPGMPAEEAYYLPLSWVVLGVCALFLLVGMFFDRFRRAVIAPFHSRRTAIPFLLVLAFVLFSLYPWNFVTAKQHETGAQHLLYMSLACGGFVLLLFALYPVLRFVDKPASRIFDYLMNISTRRFLLLFALGFFVLTNLISYFVFEHIPHIQDSISQLFQARIFASGKIHLPSPRFPDFFDYTHIINNGKWYSQYSWLHSFLLMLLVFLKAPWLLNPLCGTLTLPVVYFLAKELYDEKTARISTLVAAGSPFIFNMSSEYMNHASALLFASLFLLFFFRTVRDGSQLINPVLAGVFIGLVANIRPYTALAVATPFAIYCLVLSFRSPKRYLLRFLLLLLFTLAVTSLVFVYNYFANGNPWLFGYVVKWGPGHEVGFGHSGWGPPHTPYQGLLNMGNNLNLLNKYLLEWPIPALVIILVPFALGTRNRNDWLLFLCFLALTVAYFFYWFHNLCFGPRFLYESSTALVILTARGLLLLPELTKRLLKLPPFQPGFFARTFFLILLFLFSVALVPLWQGYHTYGSVSGTVHRNVRKAKLDNALVFCANLGNGFSYNQLNLDGPVVYCKDWGIFNPALTLAYPDRRYYYANEDTLIELTGLKYENSLLQQTIVALCAPLKDSALVAKYRTIIIPFRDLPLPVDTSYFADKITDYRTVSREIFQQRSTLNNYTPALALWLFNDKREHLGIFSLMDEPEHFIASGLKFTLKMVTENNHGAIYDIRE